MKLTTAPSCPAVFLQLLLLHRSSARSCKKDFYDEPYTNADKDRLKTFRDTRLEVDPCCNVTLGEPLEITMWFKTDGEFSNSMVLYVDLPREYTTL